MKTARTIKKKRKDSRGLILIVVIGLLAILAVLAAFFLKQSRTHKRVTQQSVLASQVKLMAQSGIEDAIAKLRQLYLNQPSLPSGQEHRYFGRPVHGITNNVPVHEFGVPSSILLDYAQWPSFAITDPNTSEPLTITITENDQTFDIGWSGSFDGTFINHGNFYGLRIDDAQSKLNINDQNPHMGDVINRLCEFLYYDEDFNRNGNLDFGEDTFENPDIDHSQGLPNNHRWDCTLTTALFPGSSAENNGPIRPWSEDQDEDGLIEPNEDLNDDNDLQTRNTGRGAGLAWDIEGDGDPLAGEHYQSKIGTFITAYLHHVIRDKDFFSFKRFSSWQELDKALQWAHQDGITNGGALSTWRPGDPAYSTDRSLREQTLEQLKPYLTLYSWQDTVPMPIGLAVSVDTSGGVVPYGRLARMGTIRSSFPDTPNNEYGGVFQEDLTPFFGIPVLGVGSEVYALREMLPRQIKMVRRAPVNINTAPLHLLAALFAQLHGVYLAEEPLADKPRVSNQDTNENLWREYFHHSRYEGNHWYRWMTPLYFDDVDQTGGALGDRDPGQYIGIGRIHRSHPIAFDVASKIAYSIECLRRGEEDLNGNGLLDQDLDYNWNNEYDKIGGLGSIYSDQDINRSTPADPEFGTHDQIDDFEDSFFNANKNFNLADPPYPGNMNLILDAPFSNWRGFNDFIDKILPDERHPELIDGVWHPHGDINRNGFLDDGGIANENRHPSSSSLSYPDHDNGYGPLCSGDLSYVQKDVIKANFNPNLHLNELNPDRLLSSWVDKLDLEVYSTEFCFESKGVFEIECLARIIDHESKVRARHRVEQNVELFRVYKEDTQKEFLGHELAQWNDISHSVEGIFSPNTLRQDENGNTDPSATTVGFGDATVFPNGQSLMSFPDVQRYDRIIDNPNHPERGAFYEGYLGLASTAVRIGGGLPGQQPLTDPGSDLLFFRDAMAYTGPNGPEGLAPPAVSSFFDHGVTLQQRGGAAVPLPATGQKLGPINRSAGDDWGTEALIPNNPAFSLDTPADYPSRNMADGVYSEAGGAIEFSWIDGLYDVRQGGGVMFWVKPSWHPEFAEKVRNFFSMAWINPSGGSPPTRAMYDTPGLLPSDPSVMENFFIADTSLLYQVLTKTDPGDDVFVRDPSQSKWISGPSGTEPELTGPWGRASYDYTNEYSGKQDWGLAPFGCYFFPNHFGSFSGWGSRYAHRKTDRGQTGYALEGIDPGVNRLLQFGQQTDQSPRLNYYGYNVNDIPGAAGGALGNTLSPGHIQHYAVRETVSDNTTPTSTRLYGYPTFRRAQEVRGLAFLDQDSYTADYDGGLYSGDLYFVGRHSIDSEFFWQRDIAFGRVEKTGRCLGWGCGFTPESFNLNAVTEDNFAGGVFSANLHPKHFQAVTSDSRRYFYEAPNDFNTTPSTRFFNVLEKGKWTHIGLHSRLDWQGFTSLGGNVVDVHPGNINHKKGFLTFDNRETVAIPSSTTLAIYGTTSVDAPWMRNGIDFMPLGAVSNADTVLDLNEMAPGDNNVGGTNSPTPATALNSFVSMDYYLEPLTQAFPINNHNTAWELSLPADAPYNNTATSDDTITWFPNLTWTFPHRRGGYFAQSLNLFYGSLSSRIGITGIEGLFTNAPPVSHHQKWDQSWAGAPRWTERFWPTINYSSEVDYLFQMFINGLMVNQGSHRWDQWDLSRNDFPVNADSPIYNTHFSRGYGEGMLVNGVGEPPASPYLPNNFFDSPQNTYRFGEYGADFNGSKLDPSLASCNYPADATFRNIVFMGSKVGNPFPPGRRGVNRDAVHAAAESGDWAFDYRPVFEHYFRGAYHAGHGSFVSRKLDQSVLGVTDQENRRLHWGRIKVNLLTTTPYHWGDFHRFSDTRHSLRHDAFNGKPMLTAAQVYGDFPDDSFINNLPSDDDTDSKNTKRERQNRSHLVISLGYGRLDEKYQIADRIGGHPRPIHRAFVSADMVDDTGLFDANDGLSERVSAASGGPLWQKGTQQSMDNQQPLHYRLELRLDELNPLAPKWWDTSYYRVNNDRELPVLESPFIDDVTLTYSVGTKILSHEEQFD